MTKKINREKKIKYGDEFKTKKTELTEDYIPLEKSLQYKFKPERTLKRFLRKYSSTYFLIYSNYFSHFFFFLTMLKIKNIHTNP